MIIYILLGGYPPFHDENQTRLFRKIKSGNFKFHTEYWGSVSSEAKVGRRGGGGGINFLSVFVDYHVHEGAAVLQSIPLPKILCTQVFIFRLAAVA